MSRQSDEWQHARFGKVAVLIAAAGSTLVPGLSVAGTASEPPKPGLIDVASPPPPAPPARVVSSPAPVIETRSPRDEVLDPATYSLDVLFRGQRIWTGELTVGGRYNNASFSQNKSEYGGPCPGEEENRRIATKSESMRIGLNRGRWQSDDADADPVQVSVNIVSPSGSCLAEGGSDSIGLTRTISLAPGASSRIDGEGSLVVKVARRW
jgi:hypothetical protein